MAIRSDIVQIIEEYIKAVREKYEIDAVYIFGSYAKGTQNEDSDIDVAIISADFNDRIDDMVELLMLKTEIDLRIEPHPFNKKEFEEENPFVEEIKNTGLKVA